MLRVRVEAEIRQGGSSLSFSRWSSYNIDHDLRNVFPTARLTAGGPGLDADELRDAIESNPEIRIKIDGTLQAVCRITSDVSGYSKRAGQQISLVCAGVSQIAAVDSMPVGWTCGEMTISEAASEIMGAVGVSVVSTATEAQTAVAERRTTTRRVVTGQAHAEGGTWVADAAVTSYVTSTRMDDRNVRPRVGETRLAFLRRMLAVHGLLCWETPDGKLFIGTPQPASTAPAIVYDMEERVAGEGRIVEIERTRRYGTYHPIIRIVGRGGSHGTRRVDVTDSDDAFLDAGWLGTSIVEAPDLRGNVEAAKRAAHMRAAERLAAYETTCIIGGHGIGTALAAIDRNVEVNAPKAGIIRGRLYCVRRAFEHSKQGGTKTSLTLIRRGLWEA